MAKFSHIMKPALLLTQLEGYSATLIEERSHLQGDINQRIEQTANDIALLKLHLFRFVSPLTIQKLMGLGLVDKNGLVNEAGRARIVEVWDRFQPAEETIKTLARVDNKD